MSARECFENGERNIIDCKIGLDATFLEGNGVKAFVFVIMCNLIKFKHFSKISTTTIGYNIANIK